MDYEKLPKVPNYLAPDGSEIRLLLKLKGGEVAHCTLPVGKTSKAVKHKTVEEIWYILEGKGEMWREPNCELKVVELTPNVCLTIPVGTHFQFRNTGTVPLKILLTTMPPWPGEDEVVSVEGIWQAIEDK